jgi:hypothetical protein
MIAMRILILLLLIVGRGFAVGAEDDPDKFAESFYKALVKLQIRGLPDEKEMGVIGDFLSDELNKRIGYAWAEHDAFVKENDTQQFKPPWTKEGNLFGSLWEGMDGFKLGQSTGDDEKKSYPVYLSYGEGKESAKWLDVLVLERTEDGWKVHNIFLNGPWDFRAHGSLRSILPEERPGG